MVNVSLLLQKSTTSSTYAPGIIGSKYKKPGLEVPMLYIFDGYITGPLNMFTVIGGV